MRRGLTTAGAMVAGFGNRINRSIGAQTTGRALGQVGAVAGAAGAAVAVGLGASIRSAVHMEDQMGALSKAADVTGPSLKGMRAGLFGLATELRAVPIDDLVTFATQGAKLGIKGEENLLGFAEGVAMVSSAADDMDPAELANELGKITQTLGLDPTQGIRQLGSAFDALADSGVSSFGDITNVVARISGIGKVAGLSGAEMGALAASLLDTGTQAELAGTTLSRVIAGVATSEGQAAMAAQLGLDLQQFAAIAQGSPMQAIQMWIEHLRTLNVEAQQSAIAEALGTEAVRATTEIMKLGQVSATTAKYVGIGNYQIATQAQLLESWAIEQGKASSGLTDIQNRMQILGVTIGDAVLPAFNALVVGLTDFLGMAQMGTAEATAGMNQWATSAVSSGGVISTAIGAVGEAIALAVDIGAAFQGTWHAVEFAALTAMGGAARAVGTLLNVVEAGLSAIPGVGDVALGGDTALVMGQSLSDQAAAHLAAVGPAVSGEAAARVRAQTAAIQEKIAAAAAEQTAAATTAAAGATAAPTAEAATAGAQATAAAINPALTTALGAISGLTSTALAGAGGTMGQVLGESVSQAAGAAASTVQFAGAAEVGSEEARKTLLAHFGRATAGDPANRQVQIANQQLTTQRQMARDIRTIAQNGSGGEIVEIPA